MKEKLVMFLSQRWLQKFVTLFSIRVVLFESRSTDVKQSKRKGDDLRSRFLCQNDFFIL